MLNANREQSNETDMPPKTTTTTKRGPKWLNEIVVLYTVKIDALAETKNVNSHTVWNDSFHSRPICWTTVSVSLAPPVNHTLGINFLCVLRSASYFRAPRPNRKKKKKTRLCRRHNPKRRIANFYLCVRAHTAERKSWKMLPIFRCSRRNSFSIQMRIPDRRRLKMIVLFGFQVIMGLLVGCHWVFGWCCWQC